MKLDTLDIALGREWSAFETFMEALENWTSEKDFQAAKAAYCLYILQGSAALFGHERRLEQLHEALAYIETSTDTQTLEF